MASASPAPQFPTLKLKLKLGKKPDSPGSSAAPATGEKRKKGPPPGTGKGVKKQRKSQSPTPGVAVVAAPPPMQTKTTYIPLGRQAGPAFLDTKSGPPRKWHKKDVTIATLSGYPMNFIGWVTTEQPRRTALASSPSVRTKVKAAPKKEASVEVPIEDASASMASSPA